MVTGEHLRRLARFAGPLSIAVAFLGILLAALLSPTFAWTGNALSDLGARGEPTAPIFNGALIAAGILGVPFVWRVWTATDTALQRAGVALLAASMVALAGVGVFPLPTREHGTVAVAFFGLFTYGFFVHGTGDVLAGDTRRGLASIWFGVAHPTAWLLWVLVRGGGIAVPELAGAALFAGWVIVQYRALSDAEEGRRFSPRGP